MNENDLKRLTENGMKGFAAGQELARRIKITQDVFNHAREIIDSLNNSLSVVAKMKGHSLSNRVIKMILKQRKAIN